MGNRWDVVEKRQKSAKTLSDLKIDQQTKQMTSEKILLLVAMLLCFNAFSTSVQAASETAEYYIDISVFPDNYAEFEIIVNNHANFSREVISLPVLECGNDVNTKYISSKIRVSDIYDYGTLTGNIDLDKSCGGITVEKPVYAQEDFTVSFIYDNFDWESNPGNYPLEGWWPFEGYSTHILLSFPEIRSDDRVWVNTINVLLPPNTNAKNIFASRWEEHPFNTSHSIEPMRIISNVRGSQQILSLEHEMSYSNGDKRAIYIPLEFKRHGSTPIFFIISVVFFVLILSFLTLQPKNIKMDIIFTIIIMIFTLYSFLAIDKPAGPITILDNAFLILICWSMLLVIIYLIKQISFWTILNIKIIQMMAKAIKFYQMLRQGIFKFVVNTKKSTIQRGKKVVLKLKPPRK